MSSFHFHRNSQGNLIKYILWFADGLAQLQCLSQRSAENDPSVYLWKWHSL